MQLAGISLADRDHELVADEHADLAELDVVGLVDVPRGADHNERDRSVVVLLDLRAQVQVLRVLDRQVVQPEAGLHLL